MKSAPQFGSRKRVGPSVHERQDKLSEARFFDEHARAEDEYNVFTDASTEMLIETCIRIAGFRPGSRIADLGCGSGIFTSILAAKGYSPIGVDLSRGLIERARAQYPTIEFIVADVEALPFGDDSLDGALLSGIVHHLPDATPFAREIRRTLRTDGAFVAFDPNRLNPFMYLYRDRSSPLYSNKGVTPNERPVVPGAVRRLFEREGFEITLDYLSGLHYRYVSSPAARVFLPVYNFADSLLGSSKLLKPFHAFVLTKGVKRPCGR